MPTPSVPPKRHPSRRSERSQGGDAGQKGAFYLDGVREPYNRGREARLFGDSPRFPFGLAAQFEPLYPTIDFLFGFALRRRFTGEWK